MRSQRSDVVIGRNPTSGGSSDTEVNEPIVKPTGSPSTIAVTTVTPVGKWPSTRRYFDWSIDITLDCTCRPHCVDSPVPTQPYAVRVIDKAALRQRMRMVRDVVEDHLMR